MAAHSASSGPDLLQLTAVVPALGLALLCTVGCQNPALSRSARSLPAGTSDWSLSFNLTHVSANVRGVPSTVERVASHAFNYPNPIPEISYRHGINDRFELGARISPGSGLLELQTKFQYLELDQRFFAALGPSLGYRALGIVNGPVLTLPALFSYELSPAWGLTGGVLASYAAYTVPRSLGLDEADLSGNTLYLGAGLGVELRAGRFHVMPALEVQRSVSRTGVPPQTPDIGLLFLSLTFGIGPARPGTTGNTPDEPSEPTETPPASPEMRASAP
jgi:hypothetical protein